MRLGGAGDAAASLLEPLALRTVEALDTQNLPGPQYKPNGR